MQVRARARRRQTNQPSLNRKIQGDMFSRCLSFASSSYKVSNCEQSMLKLFFKTIFFFISYDLKPPAGSSDGQWWISASFYTNTNKKRNKQETSSTVHGNNVMNDKSFIISHTFIPTQFVASFQKTIDLLNHKRLLIWFTLCWSQLIFWENVLKNSRKDSFQLQESCMWEFEKLKTFKILFLIYLTLTSSLNGARMFMEKSISASH